MPTLQSPKKDSKNAAGEKDYRRVEVGEGQAARLHILKRAGWTETDQPATVTLADTQPPVPAWDQSEGATPESIEAETGTPAEAVTPVPAEDVPDEPKGKAKK